VKKKLRSGVVLILLLFSVINSSCSEEPSGRGEEPKNKKAPTFTLKNIDGGSVSLKKLRGKFVLLSFWATWCLPCVNEMPLFQKGYEGWSEKNLVFLSINSGEDIGKVRGFMQRYSFTFPVLIDTHSEVSVKYNIKYFPTNILIDRDGTIIKTQTGAFENEEMIDKEILSPLGL